MPKKGHKAASRQNQLGRRKRRLRGPIRPTQSDASSQEDSPRSNIGYSQHTDEPKAFDDSSNVRKKTSQDRIRHNSSVGETLPPLKYQYLGTEVKRIGFITSGIVLILITLTFLLGG